MVTPHHPHSFVPPAFLNVTALTAQDGVSVFQCWQILPGFNTSQASTTSSSILQLGSLVNMSYSVISPGFNAGFHNAPHVQWVAYLTGLAHITLANSTDQVKIYGGKDSFIFAADTEAVSAKGHVTNYPSDSETIALQIPTGGAFPKHKVLHSGPCTSREVVKRDARGLDDLD